MDYQLILDYNIGYWGYSKQYVRSVMEKYKGKHIDVKITSLGGDLDHGLDIRQQFIDHGDVTVYLSGFVASAATVIAMGAKRIVMSKYAMFLVHKCSNFIDAWGAYNADQMQELINQLEANKKENDRIDVVLANMYAAKCGKKVSEILDVLKKGEWLTAQQALDYGFVDEISDKVGDGKLNFSDEVRRRFNALGLSTAGLEFADDKPAAQKKSLLGKIVDSIFPAKESKEVKVDTADTEPDNKSKQDSKMETQKFNAIDGLLKLDSGLSPDKEGNYCLTAAQMETVDNRLSSLSEEIEKANQSIKEKTDKIGSLETQIKNLKDAPGDETPDIKDEGGEEKISCADMYNSVKSIL